MKTLDDLSNYIDKNIVAQIDPDTDTIHLIWNGPKVTQGNDSWGYVTYKGKMLKAARANWMALNSTETLAGQVRKDPSKCKYNLCISTSCHYMPVPKQAKKSLPAQQKEPLIQIAKSNEMKSEENSTASDRSDYSSFMW